MHILHAQRCVYNIGHNRKRTDNCVIITHDRRIRVIDRWCNAINGSIDCAAIGGSRKHRSIAQRYQRINRV